MYCIYNGNLLSWRGKTRLYILRPRIWEMLKSSKSTCLMLILRSNQEKYSFNVHRFPKLKICRATKKVAKHLIFLDFVSSSFHFRTIVSFSEIEPLQLRVAEVSWGSAGNNVGRSKKLVLIPVHNETRCNCECKNKVEGCNQFQVFFTYITVYF